MTAEEKKENDTSVPLECMDEIQRAIRFLNEFYGVVDENGVLVPPLDEAIQQRINGE